MSKTAVAFIVVLLLALGWRCLGLEFESLWLDEGYQSVVDAYGHSLPNFRRVPDAPFVYKPAAPAEPSEMLRVFRNVDPLTPPLYQLLLNRWIAVFGGSDLALRSLSVAISLCAVAALFWITRGLFGLRVAVWTGLVQAFSPFDVYYAQEVRMYGLVELCATLSCGLLIMLLLHVARGRARVWCWAGYVVATWALINSHYTGLFLAMYEGMLGLAVAAATGSWRLLALLVAAWCMVAVLWIPWLGMFFQSAKLRTASFYVAREPSWWWPFYALFIKIPVNWINFLCGKKVEPAAIPSYVTAVISLTCGVRRIVFLRRPALAAGIMVALWALVPAVVLWVIDVIENHKVVEISRYVMATAPAVYIIAGLGFASLPMRKHALWVVPAIYFICTGTNNILHSTALPQREPWRDAAKGLQTRILPQELVLVAQWYNILCLDRYLDKPLRQVGVDTNMTPQQVDQLVKGQETFWLITAQEGEGFKNLIPPRFHEAAHTAYPHGLHVRLYRTELVPSELGQ